MNVITQQTPAKSRNGVVEFAAGRSVAIDDGLTIAGFVNPADLEYDEPIDRIDFHFGVSRRTFVQVLGAGLMIAVCDFPLSADAQQAPGGGRRGGGGGGGRGGFFGSGPVKLAARLHIGKDGNVTLLTGKVECGQGSRTELTEAAAEELRLPFDRVTLVMADTELCPNDGGTSGSGSTPRTVPAIRQAAATARQMFVDTACKTWSVEASELVVRDGKVIHTPSGREKTYVELLADVEAAKAFDDTIPGRGELTPVKDWKVMGVPTPRPNRRDLVSGVHRYPSDIIRPGMLYGKVLRPASFGLSSKAARLKSVDVSAAKEMDGVVVAKDGDFVGVAAPSSYLAKQAIEAIAPTAEWEHPAHPSSAELFTHLENTAQGGVPANRFKDALTAAAKSLKQDYHVAYVQHAPMEPRAAVAEWEGDKLTVWTATQNPFGVKGELVSAFRLPEDKVRAIVPDFGGGFGGKHSGECAIEAARLAKEAGKPVHLQWTRAEEFTWAYFRPSALVKAEASLDSNGKIATWYYTSINADQSELQTPYRVGQAQQQSVRAASPLRHGSYRGLGSTGHTFARECFMDELAEAAGKNPLEFRLAHLDNERIRAVLEEAVAKFDWAKRHANKQPNIGVGLACGTDKNSVVACCVEIAIDPESQEISVRKVCEVFEAGAIVNPENLLTQVQGAIIMGLGPALREEMKFEDGKMLNAAFAKYLVPRFDDVPELEIHLLNKPLPVRSPADSPSAGAGETPIIAIAPAIANAVFHATGQRMRQMPIRLAKANAQPVLPMIGAIVLAAGRSRRMGTQKLLLPFAGQTVIGHVIDQLSAAAIANIFVVVSTDGPAIAHTLSGRPVKLVENPEPDSEMLNSVRCGLRALPSDCQAVLIAVGDQPAITSSLVRKVFDAYQSSGRGIVVPVAGGKRGHPTILAARYFGEILQGFDGVGLRGLLLAHPDDLQEVEADDPALLADIDFPEDYLRAVQASACDLKRS